MYKTKTVILKQLAYLEGSGCEVHNISGHPSFVRPLSCHQ